MMVMGLIVIQEFIKMSIILGLAGSDIDGEAAMIDQVGQ